VGVMKQFTFDILYKIYYEEYKDIFNKNTKCVIWITPCKKSDLLTILRKIGDSFNQCVTAIYYCDILEYSYDNTEIYSKYETNDHQEDQVLYSSYHSECNDCKEHKQRVNDNLIIGIMIYPKNTKVAKWKEKKEKWKQFQ
jgi:hypothetical protein